MLMTCKSDVGISRHFGAFLVIPQVTPVRYPNGTLHKLFRLSERGIKNFHLAHNCRRSNLRWVCMDIGEHGEFLQAETRAQVQAAAIDEV